MPGESPAGTVPVRVALSSQVMPSAGVAPMYTPGVSTKSVPVMTTSVVELESPSLGVMPSTVGAG